MRLYSAQRVRSSTSQIAKLSTCSQLSSVLKGIWSHSHWDQGSCWSWTSWPWASYEFFVPMKTLALAQMRTSINFSHYGNWWTTLRRILCLRINPKKQQNSVKPFWRTSTPNEEQRIQILRFLKRLICMRSKEARSPRFRLQALAGQATNLTSEYTSKRRNKTLRMSAPAPASL